MKLYKSITCVDSHTVGEPLRMITGGLGHIPGNTMPEKQKYFRENLDHLRTGLMFEPRGHNDQFGAVLTEPVTPGADFGIIFIECAGYLNMCGHGTIASITIALETGIVEMKYPTTIVKMDTPAGLIECLAQCEDGRVTSVSLTNVPAFLYMKDATAVVDGKEYRFDISFGGSFFALIKAEDIGLEIKVENITALRDFSQKLEDAINEKYTMNHPELPHIKTVDLIEIYGPPVSEGADAQNVVIFGGGSVDRSPCGTGTSAKLGMMYAKGLIKENEPFVYESIIGSKFIGKIIGTTKVGDFDAVIPQITGSAYITGFNNLVWDETDPFRNGFKL